MVCTASNVMVLKIHEIQNSHTPIILAGLISISIITTIAVYAVYALLGSWKSASVALLDEIELDIIREGFHRRKGVRDGTLESVRYAARRYQRCPVRLQLSIFMHADVGMEAEFLRTVLESTINWLFMITSTSHIWLLEV